MPAPNIPKHRAVAGVSLTLLLTLVGCGGVDPSSSTVRGSSSASSSPSPTAQTAAQLNSYKPPVSAELDWWPKHQEKMATGQTFPADYEPATLDHPAKNVPKPVMPKKASEETEEGAQAFLNYYADAQWYSLITGDTSMLRDITFTGCQKCMSQMDAAERAFFNNRWGVGGFEHSIIQSESIAKDNNGVYTIPVRTENSGTILVSTNMIHKTIKPYTDSQHIELNLRHLNGKWQYITASPRGSS